jgi:hypothetical protein
VTHHDIPRRHRAEGALYNASAPPPDVMRQGYSRSRERADAVRAELTPLGPQERPLGLQLALYLAIALAVLNLVAMFVGDGKVSTGILRELLLIGAIVGLWQRRYAVVLAFEALLGVSIILAALSLLFASNLLAVVEAVVVIVVSAPIFWLLVRVMARMRIPAP